MIKKLTAILLAAIMLFALCACGATGKGGEGGEDSAANDVENEWDKDFDLLMDQGYSVNLIGSNLFSYESSINAPSGSLARLISATNEKEGVAILIYYFKSKQQAADCFKDLDPVYKNVGIRIVHGDRDNLIHD